MKTSILLLLCSIPFLGVSQSDTYTVTSYLDEGMKAPNTHYIGEAWLNGLVRADGDLGYNITKATFKANSTLDWHWHGTPQVLIVVEGAGYYQERGKAPILMKKGDVITCPKETEHWHASSKEGDVTYLAIYGGSTPTTWTEVLTQEAYDAVARQVGGQ
ncbi:cupin domain-containing protein [Robiginitalea sediminis]|uniref:cupin domain-containing protein n=1 Tax=Robiginitalea sediminis TaxID=1982593 RepID=UPI000B4BB129|nr:cupin domain-containing protein [Robiginitalea sediminis]